MAITIDRTAGDALCEELLMELTGSGDIWAEMQSGNYDAARRTRDRLLDDMRASISEGCRGRSWRGHHLYGATSPKSGPSAS